MALGKPFSEACEQNKQPILEVLEEVFPRHGQVLEIGSGTGQHAVFFAARLAPLEWLPSDVAEHLPGIRAWARGAALDNLSAPIELDVERHPWPLQTPVDGVFSANTVHIMSWPQVEQLFAGLARVLRSGAPFALYGPFNYGGRFSSESNARFDQWLKTRDPASGVRDFEALDRLAEAAGLRLEADRPMPVNNRTLVWRKR